MRRGFAGLVAMCLIVGLWSLSVSTTQAQEASVPRVIQFGGVLSDHVGQPLTGVLGVTFALYREQFDGSPCGSSRRT